MTPPDGLVIDVQGLSKRYGRDGWALRDVELSVRAGETVALVGPNGAGKSTLIRALIGFESVRATRLEVNGADVRRDRAAVIRSIGYVPQADALFSDLTVSGHLALAGALRGTFDDATAEARLDAVGIGPQRRVATLSGGQRAQVMLALALGTRAPVLLLDEPLASLDPLARREFLRGLPAAAGGRSVSVVLASHNVGDVEESCERLVVLGSGRVLLDAELAHARRTHRVVSGERATREPGVIGRFAGPRGDVLAVVHAAPSSRREVPTTEELVLAYLAGDVAGRDARQVA